MKKKYSAMFSAAIAMIMTACGTISPPTAQTTTAVTTAETNVQSLTDLSSSSDSDSKVDSEKIQSDTFIAEFFDSNICFADISALVTEAMKGSSFENEIDNSNGGGMIDVLCIDLSQSDLDHDMEYILENFGDYYFGQTSAQMSGITEDDFVSSYRMTSSVVSKGKYQQYGSVQKSDGMATQFGYTETYAVLSENKLTVVSGAFLSTDMMERQSFSQLMSQFVENVKY